MAEPVTLEQRITRIIEEQLHIEVPSPQADLLAAGAIDSLTFVDLLLHLEEAFDLTIDVAQIQFDEFRSVRSIAAFVGRRLAPEPALGAGS